MVNYLRDPGELGSVSTGIFPDDDMALGLVICQTKGIWDVIHLELTPRRSPFLM